MLYKPSFCCHCGEKIERVDWNVRTSRRFCDLCATEFQLYEWLPKIGLGVGALLFIFFVGSFFQTPDKAELSAANKFPDNLRQKENSPVQEIEKQAAGEPGDRARNGNLIATPSAEKQTNSQSGVSIQGLQSSGQTAEQLQTRQNAKKEPVYFCGAETKKGTPCTRRVKGGGRCWQHAGKDAMLPDKQLLASQ